MGDSPYFSFFFAKVETLRGYSLSLSFFHPEGENFPPYSLISQIDLSARRGSWEGGGAGSPALTSRKIGMGETLRKEEEEGEEEEELGRRKKGCNLILAKRERG